VKCVLQRHCISHSSVCELHLLAYVMLTAVLARHRGRQPASERCWVRVT
jgi:hypothetical protein